MDKNKNSSRSFYEYLVEEDNQNIPSNKQILNEQLDNSPSNSHITKEENALLYDINNSPSNSINTSNFAHYNDPTMIIDMGSCYLKLGILPQPELRSDQSLQTPQLVYHPWHNSENMNSNFMHDYEDIQEMFFDAFKYKFPIDFRNNNYLFCESEMQTSQNFIKIGELFFELFEASSVSFQDPELLARNALFNKITVPETLLLVDMGASTTKIVPFVSNFCLSDFSYYLNIGGYDMDYLILRDMDNKQKTQQNTSQMLTKARLFKERNSKVFENAEDAHMEFLLAKDTNSLDNSQIAYLLAPEIYFNNNLLYTSKSLQKRSPFISNCHSLPKAIHDIIKKCPIDYRLKLFNNIVLYGGCSSLPGLFKRLALEVKNYSIEQYISQEINVKCYSSLSDDIRKNASWVGAYLFAQLDIFHQEMVTKEQYFEEGNNILAMQSKIERLKMAFN